MAIEQGVVIKLGDEATTAWVMTTRSGACESCASRESCRTGATGQTHEVEALNTVGARVGDRIQMKISTASLLKATFLLYVFPILCMLLGAVAANWIAVGLRLNPSVMAGIGALVAFAASLVIVRIRGRRLGADTAYQPQIIRVLRHISREHAKTVPPFDCQGTDPDRT